MPEQIPQQPNKSENLEKKIDLHSLLIYENPRLAEYQELIRKEFEGKRHQYGQEFADSWVDVFHDRYGKGEKEFRPADYKKVLPYLQGKLREGILVDLGGNLRKGVVMVQFAKKCEAVKYINVDTEYVPEGIIPVGADYNPYFGKERPDANFWLLSSEENRRVLEVIDVQADMLNFVARLPDNSVNFTVNGIDAHIIKNQAYRNAIVEEMSRATKIGGVIFGWGSDFWPSNTDPRYKSVGEELEFDDGDTYIPKKIFEKVK